MRTLLSLYPLVQAPRHFPHTHSLSLPHTQECPSGVVNEETFKQIYAQFFPHGGEYMLGKMPSQHPLQWSAFSFSTPLFIIFGVKGEFMARFFFLLQNIKLSDKQI